MAEETLALNVVIDGFSKFSLGMQAMDAAINVVGKAWDALSGPAVAAVDAAADFESQMADLGIAARSTGIELDDLEKAALSVGGASDLVGVSASDAAESMTGLFKAGLSATEIFGDFNETMEDGNNLGGALRAAIDLAAASELDMVQASDLAAIALASFGGELETEAERAEFINEALDNMVKAADASVAEVSGLADALVNVGPKASALGISIQDTNNALAILSTRGIQGATAGTNLRSMLDNLFRDTKPVQEAISALGLQLFDTNGEFVGLRSVVEQLQTAFAGATQEERAYFTQQLAGTFGQNALNALLAEGAEGWDDMALATEQAAGIAEQAAAKSKTFRGQMEALEGVLETIQIQIGTAFLPVIKQVVELFTEFSEFIGPAIEGTLARMEPLFGELSSQIKVIFDNLMSFLSGGTGLIEFFDNMEPAVFRISKTLFEMGMIVKELAQEVAIFIAGALARFGKWFEENRPLILQTVQVIVSGFKDAAQGIKKFWQLAKPVLEALGELLLDVFTLIMQIVVGDWEGAWETIQQIVADAWIAIQELFVFFTEWVASWFNSDVAEIRAMWRDNWEQFKTILGLAWDAMITMITTKLDDIKQKVIDGIKAIGVWIEENFPMFAAWGKAMIEQIAQGIADNASKLKEKFTEAMGKLKDAIDRAEDFLKGIGGKIIEFVSKGLGDASGSLSGALNSLLQTLTPSEETMSFLRSIGGMIVKAFRAGIEAGWDAFTAWLDNILGNIVPDILCSVFGICPGGGVQRSSVQSAVNGTTSPIVSLGGASSMSSNSTTNNFNLTTQSIMRPGGVEMEFEEMGMATR